MVALFSPQLSSSLGWPFENPISLELENLNYFNGDGNKNIENNSADSIDHVHYSSKDSSAKAHTKNGGYARVNNGLIVIGDESGTMKKLNHNANERDRRKKINSLYSTLRSRLPLEDQSGRLSIPDTVSRVLNYIPQLQKEVEMLSKKKESLMTSSEASSKYEEKVGSAKNIPPLPSVVSATSISEGEVVIHFSMPKAEKNAISEVLMRLEEEGFIAINATSYELFDGRVFCNLHLQLRRSQVPIDAERLKKKVCPILRN